MEEPMRTPLCDMVAIQFALGRRWMDAMVSITHAYTSIMDPRPDLSVPARTVRDPYRWWW